MAPRAVTGEVSSPSIRRAAGELLVLVTPFLLLGAVLTASLFGAIFGVPLLAVSWLVWRSGRLARRSPDDAATARRLRVAATAFSSVLTVVLVGVVIVGANDLDSAVDVAGLVVAVLWVAAAWHASVTALRAHAPPA